MNLSKDQFFERMIIKKETLGWIRKQFPDQKSDFVAWYNNDEYKQLRKVMTYFHVKAQSKSFTEVVDFGFIKRISEWRKAQDPICRYCGLPESELANLHSLPNHVNKRWPQRGKSLEIDRRNSEGRYGDITNIVLACYWCNNAKTDTFTYKEFRDVGKIINSVWKNRLNKTFLIPKD